LKFRSNLSPGKRTPEWLKSTIWHAKPDSRMFKRGSLVNLIPNKRPEKPAEKPAEKPSEKKGE
jgi:hypothetical protein